MFRALRSGWFLGWLYAFACSPLGVAAQSASEDRATSFEAVSGPVKEDIAGGPLLLIAYGLVWLAVFVFVFRLVRLHKGLEDNLSRVERAVGSAGSKDVV